MASESSLEWQPRILLWCKKNSIHGATTIRGFSSLNNRGSTGKLLFLVSLLKESTSFKKSLRGEPPPEQVTMLLFHSAHSSWTFLGMRIWRWELITFRSWCVSLTAREGVCLPVPFFSWMVLVGNGAGRLVEGSCYKECFISTGFAPRAGGEREWLGPRWNTGNNHPKKL